MSLSVNKQQALWRGGVQKWVDITGSFFKKQW